MKEKYVGKIMKVLRKEAEKNVNNVCLSFCHQPKESAALRKLKKKQGN